MDNANNELIFTSPTSAAPMSLTAPTFQMYGLWCWLCGEQVINAEPYVRWRVPGSTPYEVTSHVSCYAREHLTDDFQEIPPGKTV